MPETRDRELRMLDQAAAEFAAKELAPNREENDKFPFGPFCWDVVEKAHELDFFHFMLPDSLNGLNQGMSALCRLLENLCREDSSLGAIVFTNTAAQEILLGAGAEQALAGITEGKAAAEVLLGLPVFVNPAEVEHLPFARKTGDGYVLSGPLEYMVLGGVARHALIPGRMEGIDGFSWFLVDLSRSRVRKSEPVLSLGLRACPAVDLDLGEAEARLIGREGGGEACFNRMADRFHIAAAAMSAGVMKGAFKEALEYARGRFQGGRKIIQWSEVKMMLADMAVQIENADMILASACQAVDAGRSGWERKSRAAALHIQKTACEAATDGVQVMGGVGYMKDYGQEKRMRDARQLQSLLGLAPLKRIRFIEKMIKSEKKEKSHSP